MSVKGAPVLIRGEDGRLEWALWSSVSNDTVNVIDMTGETQEIDAANVFLPSDLASQGSKIITTARVYQEFDMDVFGDIEILRLKEGDMVEVLDLAPADTEEGWCKVKKDNDEGMYPLVLLEFCENF